MVKADIVILDSGVNLNHKILQYDKIIGESISINNLGNVKADDNIQDTLGHGTAIYSIIKKNAPESSIWNIKLFTNQTEISDLELYYALKYIKENVQCKIINLSLGITFCENVELLKDICSELYHMGIILVSAFDNDGSFSYPAVFDNVIGVGASEFCKSSLEFEFVESSPINILAKASIQRVPWLEPEYVMFGGNSFACANITAFIYNYLKKEDKKSFIDVLRYLKGNSVCTHNDIHNNHHKYPCEFFKPRKAALFPFNKEMHSLIRFSDELKFEIKDVYDMRHSGKVGAKASKFVDNLKVNYDIVIKNVTNIVWEEIDTIILGHTGEMEANISQNLKKTLIKDALIRNKNIISFDPLECYTDLFFSLKNESKIYWPKIDSSDIPQNTFEKLYSITKPVVGIFGTSSRQGKFSLQLLLENKCQKKGIRLE